jgi:hypothetical protein
LPNLPRRTSSCRASVCIAMDATRGTSGSNAAEESNLSDLCFRHTTAVRFRREDGCNLRFDLANAVLSPI